MVLVALLKLFDNSGVKVAVINAKPPFKAKADDPEILRTLESFEVNVQVPATELPL